jgi:hypothetical protein
MRSLLEVLVKAVMHQIDFVYQDMIADEKLNGAKLTLIETPSGSREGSDGVIYAEWRR